ncbi:LPXTG cell wall anchor domain-containing protein [Enterococcus sp. AZ192]|uniref:LPXTG cell wall anchor domain-containing protein n=1 Tax=unclassified Enterococcus TaxID=2608891 RepID=UPI003D288900
MINKKCLMLGLLFCTVSLSFVSRSFAEEASSSTETLMTTSSESTVQTEKQAKVLDITPEFTVSTIKTTVGEKGSIEVKPVERIKDLKGTFKVTVADPSVLSINEKGIWQGLKAGTTKATIDFEWSKDSLKKIQEKFPEHELAQKSIAKEVPVTVAEEKIVGITPKYNVSAIKAKIGDTGQFTVEPMGGVSDLKGTFTAYIKDEHKDIISVDANGKWTALKAGTTEFVLDYKLSDESYKAIQDKNPGSILRANSIATVIKAEVTPVGTMNITPMLDIASIEGKVGDIGQLKVKPIEGMENPTGSFTFSIKDPSIIEIDKDGNWKALKAGTTEFTYTYTWSRETMKQLSEKYPGYEFAIQELAQVVKVTITDGTISSTKPAGTTKPTGKQLPATNEASQQSWILAVGLMLLILTLAGWSKKSLTNQ